MRTSLYKKIITYSVKKKKLKNFREDSKTRTKKIKKEKRKKA